MNQKIFIIYLFYVRMIKENRVDEKVLNYNKHLIKQVRQKLPLPFKYRLY